MMVQFTGRASSRCSFVACIFGRCELAKTGEVPAEKLIASDQCLWRRPSVGVSWQNACMESSKLMLKDKVVP